MVKRKKGKMTAFCYWCERTLEPSWSQSSIAFTRDHIVPQEAVGGGGKWLPCCRACNAMKGNMMPDDWRKFMTAHPQWWKHYPTTAESIIRYEMLGK